MTAHHVDTGTRRLPRAHRGQALIMAVLLMFLLVGLSGVFIAMINQTLVQTARAADRAKLEGIAQVGMNVAEDQLRNSALGADWRPDSGPDNANPGWHYANDGFYKITLTYGRYDAITSANPFMKNPLDRYLKVDIEARFTINNPPDFTDPANEDQVNFSDGYKRGKLLPQKFLVRKVTAYMPIGLTDYLVWVTNLYDTGEPAVLGSDLPISSYGDGNENLATLNKVPYSFGSDDAFNSAVNTTAISVRYLPVYDGPIRTEGDLQLGDGRFDQTRGDTNYITHFLVDRHDRVEVGGRLSAYADSSAACRYLMVNNHNVPMVSASPPTSGSSVCGFEPLSYLKDPTKTPIIIQYLETASNSPSVPRLHAPKLNQDSLDRYRALTQDIREGIYINNPDQIQYGGNLDLLRQEWVNTSGGCWQSGVYKPYESGQAVRIKLHDWTYAASAVVTQLPQIDIYASNPILKDENGNNTTHTTALYPPNGVIFAEGNVVVEGNLPAAAAYDYSTATNTFTPLFDGSGKQQPGGWNKTDDSIRYYVNAANRRFDLTIVSGGTIYIGGNILSPSSRKDDPLNLPVGGHYLMNNAGLQRAPIQLGDAYDTKVALLAADNVCLNPTGLFADFRNTDGSVKLQENSPPATDYFRSANQGSSVFTFSFSTPGPLDSRMRLLLRHAADSAAVNGADNASHTATTLQMSVNGHPFQWNLSMAGTTTALNLQFCNTADVSSVYPYIPLSNYPQFPEWPDRQWGGGFYNTLPTSWGMQSWKLWDPNRYDGITSLNRVLFGFGQVNTIRFNWFDNPSDPNDGAGYLLSAGTTDQTYASGALLTCVDLQVDALIYAQRGSWFVIPGPYWYDNDPAPKPAHWPFPGYREPYDVRITINGAISENTTAPPEMEQQWTEHWRGANVWYYSTTGDGKPDMRDPGANSQWNSTDWRWTGAGGAGSATDNRRMGITYIYDATLARPICYDVDAQDPSIRYYLPRLPKLPIGPELLQG